MPSLESRPYSVAAPNSVTTDIALVEPNCSFAELPEVWEQGQALRVRASVVLARDFWGETGLTPSDPICAVLNANCPSARLSVREQLFFSPRDDGTYVATGELDLSTSGVGIEVLLTTSVIGNGRTLATSGGTHVGAILWETSTPKLISLESDTLGFPTSAVSFSETGRRRVPWLVETVATADPMWSISSSIRVYLNSDLPSAGALAAGTADGLLYQALQTDIHLATLYRLASAGDAFSGDDMEQIAEGDPESLAALGVGFANSMGITIKDAVRMVAEDVNQFIARSREVLEFGR